jgi:hypothetical protein
MFLKVTWVRGDWDGLCHLILLQTVGALEVEVKRRMALVMVLKAAVEVTKPYKRWWCSILKCGAVGQWANPVNAAPRSVFQGQTLVVLSRIRKTVGNVYIFVHIKKIWILSHPPQEMLNVPDVVTAFLLMGDRGKASGYAVCCRTFVVLV